MKLDPLFDVAVKAALGVLAFLAMDSFSKLNASIQDLNASQKELSQKLSQVVAQIAAQAASQDGFSQRLTSQEERIRFLEQGRWKVR
jgi:outer membrane murein-binding lipoprotein Lpp